MTSAVAYNRVGRVSNALIRQAWEHLHIIIAGRHVPGSTEAITAALYFTHKMDTKTSNPRHDTQCACSISCAPPKSVQDQGSWKDSSSSGRPIRVSGLSRIFAKQLKTPAQTPPEVACALPLVLQIPHASCICSKKQQGSRTPTAKRVSAKGVASVSMPG